MTKVPAAPSLFALSVVLLGLAIGMAASAAGGSSVRVAIDPRVRHQTILGWGKTAPEMPASQRVRDLVLDRAVNDLGLTRLRIEPPGGKGPQRRRWEWLNDNADPDDINWSALNTQQFDRLLSQWVVPFKQRVEARGEPFNCYVSPSFFNHGSTGEVPAWLLHSPGEYAEYALSLLLYMKEKYGLVADYYCICNEAGNDNLFSPQVVARMIKTLGPRLRAAGLPTTIEFPESINAREAWRYVQAVQADREVLDYLGVISYHWYGKNNQQYMPKLRRFALAHNLPTAQTEYMWLKIDHLYDDLTLGGVSFWEIYGLAGVDYRAALSHASSTTFRGGPQYWTFRQVLHYVRPGAVRIEAKSSEEALRALAFAQPTGITVVLINTSEPLRSREVEVQGLPAGTYGICQSVAARPYRELGLRRVGADGRLTVEVPQQAVLTIYPRTEENLPPTLTQWRSEPDFLTLPASELTLVAAAQDPELDALAYSWSVVHEPRGAAVELATPREPTTRATGLTQPGEYVFRVAVSDGRHTVKREVMLRVFEDNQPPVLFDMHNRIPVMVTLPQEGTQLRGAALDPEGDEVSYHWSVLSHPAGAQVKLETPTKPRCQAKGLSVPGEYVFRLEASDGHNSVAQELRVTVYPANSAPVIEQAGAKPSTLVPPADTTELVARVSDPEGDVVSVWWEVQEAPAGAKVSLVGQGQRTATARGLSVPGRYVFRLTAVDRTKTATAEVVVTVAEGP